MTNISTFQFSDPEMIEFKFKKMNYKAEDRLEGNLTFDFAYTEFTEENGKMTSSGRLRLRNFPDDVDIDDLNIPYLLDISFSSKFLWDLELNDEEAHDLLNINGQAMLMSYMRPVITSILAFVKGPKMRIPFIDFTNKDND